jgi:maltose/moltooligosaccharide transporter
MGVPYLLAVAAVPKERYGVYRGIVNMMIVVLLLIETFTFGRIDDTVLNADPTSAITLAGILPFVAAVAMLWIRQAPLEQDVEEAAVAQARPHACGDRKPGRGWRRHREPATSSCRSGSWA